MTHHAHAPKPRWRHLAIAAYLGVITLAVVLLGSEQRGIEERIVRVEQSAACAKPRSRECEERLTLIVRALEAKQACIILRKAGVRCSTPADRSRDHGQGNEPGRRGSGAGTDAPPGGASSAPAAPGSASPTTTAPPSPGAPPAAPPGSPPGTPPSEPPGGPPPAGPAPGAPGSSSIDVLPGHPVGPLPCVNVGLATVNC